MVLVKFFETDLISLSSHRSSLALNCGVYRERGIVAGQQIVVLESREVPSCIADLLCFALASKLQIMTHL